MKAMIKGKSNVPDVPSCWPWYDMMIYIIQIYIIYKYSVECRCRVHSPYKGCWGRGVNVSFFINISTMKTIEQITSLAPSHANFPESWVMSHDARHILLLNANRPHLHSSGRLDMLRLTQLFSLILLISPLTSHVSQSEMRTLMERCRHLMHPILHDSVAMLLVGTVEHTFLFITSWPSFTDERVWTILLVDLLLKLANFFKSSILRTHQMIRYLLPWIMMTAKQNNRYIANQDAL